VIAATSTAMNDGTSDFKTALAADRANATTGDYANTRSLVSKLGGADRATASASGSYSALDTAPLAKDWLQTRMTSVAGGIQLKLQYSTGATPTFSDATNYKTIGEYDSGGRYSGGPYGGNGSNEYFSDRLNSTSDNLRYINPSFGSDNYEDSTGL
jgi:hypothetical protein